MFAVALLTGIHNMDDDKVYGQNISYVIVIAILLIASCYATRLTAAERLPISTFIFPPFNFVENGRVVGSEIDVVRKVFQRMGYELDVEVRPIQRAYAETVKGNFVALVALSETPQRFSDFYPSDPISWTKPELAKRKDADIVLKTVDDYSPHLVGITKGFHYTKEFEESVAAGNIRVFELAGQNTELQHLKMLDSGRVDLVFSEANVISHLMKIHSPEFDKLERVGSLSGIVYPHHLLFSKNWPNSKKLTEQFNIHLAAFWAGGEAEGIWDKYGIVVRLPKSK